MAGAGELRELEPRERERDRTAPVPHAERWTLFGRGREDDREAFAADVRAGLSADRKRLSCAYLYDRVGSELFEKICVQPEYYPTRAEAEILEHNARDILAGAPEDLSIVELGSGSSVKTRTLIDAWFETRRRLHYVPIDISRTMLEKSARALVADYPGLSISALACEYRAGLRALKRVAPGPKLVLWLGSNVGNFERPAAAEFLRAVRDAIDGETRLIVGVDLRKDRDTLEAAYDDAAGVTAAFNLNLLARINRDLGGHFDLDAFRHRAVWNEAAGRIEITIDSLRDQTVAIDALGLAVDFAEGEAIHTENSHKYSLAEIDALAAEAGLAVNGRWFDARRRFSLNRMLPA